MLPPQATTAGVRLVLRNITKAFPGVVANDQVTLEVRSGEVHALLGENGAGKTTLMNILYGIYQPDAGAIELDGRPVRIRSPHDAIALGIGMVPQHFLLVRRHTVAENIALGLAATPFVLPIRETRRRIREFGARYGLGVDPDAYVWQLSVSEQQRVEILKALLRGAEILVLDEPTSVLTPQEAEQLFGVLRRMKAEGHAVIFITHKLDEVFAVADRVTVLRRGRVVQTLPISQADKRGLARMMVGQDVELELPPRAPVADQAGLVVEDLWVRNDLGLDAVRGVTFTVRRGEIFGIAGVAGNGQRELVEAITGLRAIARGHILALGRDITGAPPDRIHATGIAHIPEERVRTGIVPGMSVAENLILKRYREPPFARGPLLDGAAVQSFAHRMIGEYGIAAPSARTPARSLSGGNIQRLILARELATDPALIIAAHPTFGLDVRATRQIHTLLLRRRDAGAGVLLISEDLDEILTLSDRIGVMVAGELRDILPAADADREHLGLMMAGHRT